MKFLLLFPLLLTLCSCWDYTEPGTQNYVLGFSVDYIDGEFDVCIETVKVTGEPESLSSSEGVIIESRGASIFEAVRDAIMIAGKKLYWGHTEIVILSDAVMKEHLYSVIDVISRSQNIYSNVNLAVAKGCLARDVMYAKTPRDVMVSVYISNIIKNEEPSRRFKSLELWQLKRNFPYTLIPSIGVSVHPFVSGCGVIADSKLIGYLNGEETQLFTLLEDPSSYGGYLPCINVDGISLSLEILHTKVMPSKNSCRVDMVVALSNADAPIDTKTVTGRNKIEKTAALLVQQQIDSLNTKPFGKLLSFHNYDVHITLDSTGLKRW